MGNKVYLDDNGNPIQGSGTYLDDSGNPATQQRPTYTQEKPSLIEDIKTGLANDPVVQFNVGAAKSFGNAAYGAGKLIHEGLSKVPFLRDIAHDDTGFFDKAPEALTPTNGSQRVGAIAGNVGMAIAPVGPTQAALGIKGAKGVLPALGRIATEAGLGGTMNAVEGGDFGEGAKWGALGGATGEALAGAKPVANALKNSAANSYASMFRPVGKYDKQLVEKVVPDLLQKHVWSLTRGGIAKTAEEQVSSLGQSIREAVDALPPGTSIPMRTLEEGLEGIKSQFGIAKKSAKGAVMYIGATPEQQAALNAIDGYKNFLIGLSEQGPKGVGRVIPYENLWRARQLLDAAVPSKGFVGDIGQNINKQMYKSVADTFRHALNETGGDTIQTLNKEYSFWRNVQDAIDASIMRDTGKAGGGLATVAAKEMAGAATGTKPLIYGSYVNLFKRAFTSPAWATTSAVVKNQVADMLSSGDVRSAASILVRLGLGTARGLQQ